MPARAWSTTRSAAAICSSRARTSGSNAFSRASQLATATSFSCNDSSASRSGCTLPPCNLVTGIHSSEFIENGALFHGPLTLFFGLSEWDLAIKLFQSSLQGPRPNLLQSADQYFVRIPTFQTTCLQVLVDPCRELIQFIRSVQLHCVKSLSIAFMLDFGSVDLLKNSLLPALPFEHHQYQVSLHTRCNKFARRC